MQAMLEWQLPEYNSLNRKICPSVQFSVERGICYISFVQHRLDIFFILNFVKFFQFLKIKHVGIHKIENRKGKKL